MTASLKWRLNFTATVGGGAVAMYETQMRTVAGTSQLFSGGTATASSSIVGGPEKATDNLISSTNYWSANGSSPQWWQYDFAAPVDIVEYTITSLSASTAPSAWQLQYWDGSAFIAVDTRTGVTDWGTAETRTFRLGFNPSVQHTQSVVEVLRLPSAPNLQLATSVIEVLRTNGTESFPVTAERMLSMQYVHDGQPFVRFSKGIPTTPTLDVAQGSQPFNSSFELSSSTNHTAEITETANATESSDGDVTEATISAEVVETATATDTTDAILGAVASHTETANATEVQEGFVESGPGSVVETATATEDSAATVQSIATLTETANADTEQHGAVTTRGSIMESASATQTSSATKLTPASRIESATATATQSASVSSDHGLVETADATAECDARVLRVAEVVETAEAIDIIGVLYEVSIEETADATDALFIPELGLLVKTVVFSGGLDIALTFADVISPNPLTAGNRFAKILNQTHEF